MTAATLFRVAPEVFAAFPNYFVACVVARGIDRTPTSARFEELVLGSGERARATYEGLDLKDEPPFAAWRKAFSQAGWSPSRFPASVEAIHKRVQRGADLPRINTPVDLANSAALYYAVPVGTHDIASFAGQPLEVRYARGADRFNAMGGEEERPDAGEIVYAVGSDIRTRRWVWRQGRSGLVSADALDIFFPIDGFADETFDAVVAAQNYLAEVCAADLSAHVETAIVDAGCPELTIDLDADA